MQTESQTKTVVSKTSMTKTVVSNTGVSQTKTVVSSISNSGSSNNGADGRVVDQMRSREGLRHGGVSVDDSGFTLLHTLSSSVGSKMLSGGSSDFRGYLGGSGGHSGVYRGYKRLGVEGGGNSIIDGSNGEHSVEFGANWETRILNTESKSISDVSDGLKDSVGVDIRVSSVDSSISVSDLLFHRVDVGISVVEVSEFILGMELASGSVVRSVRVGNGGNDGGMGNSVSSVGVAKV